jgi:hypothetical protein
MEDEKLSVIFNKLPSSRSPLYEPKLFKNIHSFIKGANSTDIFVRESLRKIGTAFINETLRIVNSIEYQTISIKIVTENKNISRIREIQNLEIEPQNMNTDFILKKIIDYALTYELMITLEVFLTVPEDTTDRYVALRGFEPFLFNGSTTSLLSLDYNDYFIFDIKIKISK